MSRTVKRVPLDFDWPLDKVWEGYQMPERLQLPRCADCDGRGTSGAADWLSRIVELLLTAAEGSVRTKQSLHPYIATMRNRPSRNPSADLVELTAGLAERPMSPFGHDSFDQWTATRKIIEVAGLDPDAWGRCPACDGEGNTATPEQRVAHDAWERTEPPTGDGWQLWETVSEGSPVSPVFPTPEALAHWLVRSEGYRPSAAWRLAAQGGSAGVAVGRGGKVYDANRDADVLAGDVPDGVDVTVEATVNRPLAIEQ